MALATRLYMHTYNDIAIPISWPDQTARGDEKWMAILKKAGIVKNLNFKVGHAAILLIERASGKILYYDFGRYLVPRGYGRARSILFDRRLQIITTAAFNGDVLVNLEELLEELYRKESATHGGGRLLFSICNHISFSKGVAFADALVKQGPVLYGALARKNNSCSRFVAQVMVAAMRPKDIRIRKILYPECLKSSPTSNVVNATVDNMVYCYHQHQLCSRKMTRIQSLQFQLALLKENFSGKAAKEIAADTNPGLADAPHKPLSVPEKAQWLGGIGEGAWFHIEETKAGLYNIYKFNHKGEEEYKVLTTSTDALDVHIPYYFTFHFNYNKYSILQNKQILILTTIEPPNNFSNETIQEEYATHDFKG